MTKHTRNAVSDLLNAYSELCPEQFDEDQIKATVAGMNREGASDIAICKTITAGICNGLMFGNWPSALRKT